MGVNIKKGKLIKWNDKKGFGFIKPELGGRDIFIHISSLKKIPRKPMIGDIIFYEIHSDNNGKQRAVNSRINGLETVHKKLRTKSSHVLSKTNKKSKTSSLIFSVLIIVFLGSYVFSFLSKPKVYDEETFHDESTRYIEIDSYAEEYTCSGKTYCSEMNSCEEATFYLRNCPGTKIDGNHDGVPCESQWCQ